MSVEDANVPVGLRLPEHVYERAAQAATDEGRPVAELLSQSHWTSTSLQTYFIFENRHFLAQLTDLPFEVLTSQQAVDLLG